MRPEPSLRQLRHFLSVAEHRHFGRAAEACLLTQSSLSSSIKELEVILEASLFERTKRSVMLTPFGREMLIMARDILVRVDALMDWAMSAGAPLMGELRLGVIPTISPFLLPRVLPSLRAVYPDLRLYLREDQTAPLLQQMTDGKLDVVLLALPYETGDFSLFEFATDPFVVVFPRGHELARFETMTPTRLSRETILLLEAGNCLTDQAMAMGKLSTVLRNETFQASSLHTLVQMVDNGLGVTVLPKMALDAGILRGLKLDFRPFSTPRAARRIALAWRKSSFRAEEYKLLGQHMRDELATPLPARG